MSADPTSVQRFAPYAVAAVGVGCLSLMDAFMKTAAIQAGAYSATVLRSLFAAAMIAPVWVLRDRRWPSRHVMKLHLERGVISAFMALSFFFALTKLPLAEAIAMSFIAPIIALYFARVFLGEEIRTAAIAASVLGFAGTLVIIGGQIGLGGDNGQAVSNDYLLGLASLAFSALLYAYNFIVIRRQSQVAGPVEVATFHSGVGGLILLMFAPFAWAPPQSSALVSIAIASTLTVAGSMAITWAYARAEAQALVPIEYSGFLWASILGWVFFREDVTVPTLVGAALIVLGCWLAARKDNKSA